MRIARFSSTLVTALSVASVLASCGPGGNGDAGTGGSLSGDGPLLTETRARVRTVVVTRSAPLAQAMLPESCAMQGYLFDAPAPRALTPVAAAGECALYGADADLMLEAQRWICAGAIIARYGPQEVLTACRAPGDPLRPEVPISCTGLTPAATVSISSGPDESDGTIPDVVPDLNAMVVLPGALSISLPSAIGVTTWEPTGDLAVAWSSANATSAVATLTARGQTSAFPAIVCQPRTNGTVAVPQSLIDMANFRTQDVILRVASYRDATATAEGGMTYRISGGFAASVLLQARR